MLGRKRNEKKEPEMPRVSEKLRQQWRYQREHMVEYRIVDERERRRSREDIAIVDFDIAVMDALLALPVGVKFDAQEVQKELLKKGAPA